MIALRLPRAATRRAATRGQAMVEFAIVLALLMVIVVTSIEMVPAITARGTVLNAAATAVERSNSYLASDADNLADQEDTLCNEALAVVRSQLIAGGLPSAAVTKGTDGCRNGAPDNTHNPVVSVNPDSGVASLVVKPGATVGLTVCVSYRYDFGAGLLWLASKGPGDIGTSTQKLFTYKFCGRSVLDANRTR